MTNDEIVEAARRDMQAAYDADRANRDRDASDRRFAAGDQWPEEDRANRELAGRPCLTFNALSHHVRMVTSQIRGINPAIKVSAADSAAQDDVAEVIEGIVRHVEQRCDAPSVYEGAAESAAQGGIGWFRLRADYCDDASFDQELVVEPIYNPFAVFCDPFARHPTRKDSRFIFIAEEVPEAEFSEQYPDATPADATNDHQPAGMSYWRRSGSVVVAEYYWVEREEVTIGLMPDGRVVPGATKKQGAIRTRTAAIPRVKWAKVTGDQVLEGPLDIPGRYIPVFAVVGEEIHLGEEVIRSGVVRHAKDAQTLYNVAQSAQAEVVGMQPKAPYVLTVKQIAGLEGMWAEANTSNRPYLVYNPDEKAGRPARETPPVVSPGWLTIAQVAADDIKRGTGIYDASLGARSNETSGVAIAQRKQESQASTSIYADNMVKAIRQCGQVMIDMIPHVYDTQRVVQILGPDGTEKAVVINELMMSAQGVVYRNDVRAGRYAVRVNVGPAYETLRAEAREGMMQFLQAVPAAGQVTADLVAAAQDWPNADQFAERLKKTLPPGMADDAEGEPDAELQGAVNAQLQQIVPQLQQQMMQSAEAAKIDAEIRKSRAEAAEAEAQAKEAQAKAAEAELKVQAMMAGLMQPQQPAATA